MRPSRHPTRRSARPRVEDRGAGAGAGRAADPSLAPHWTVGLAQAANVEVIGGHRAVRRERRRGAPAIDSSSPSRATTGNLDQPPPGEHLAREAPARHRARRQHGTAILRSRPPQHRARPVIECSSTRSIWRRARFRIGILLTSPRIIRPHARSSLRAVKGAWWRRLQPAAPRSSGSTTRGRGTPGRPDRARRQARWCALVRTRSGRIYGEGVADE